MFEEKQLEKEKELKGCFQEEQKKWGWWLCWVQVVIQLK